MEKTTKKKKTKKGLKKRIGIIAVGGLSLVLTVCLSVGATLAWFAGSTWADKSLYMGGPVYVEMAGRGTAGSTTGENEGEAEWVGGSGNLDIQAAAARTTGTATENNSAISENESISSDVLLPGQKVQIYSQARVFSTLETDSTNNGAFDNQSSGANTANTSNPVDGKVQYVNNQGRVTTTTTSVLRARFSINVEFDPSVGFNNFTTQDYMSNYPVQSTGYNGEKGSDITDTTWETAMSTSKTADKVFSSSTTNGVQTITGRRDGVSNTDGKETPSAIWTDDTSTKEVLEAIQKGTIKSIYSWKYCSSAEYKVAATAEGEGVKYVQMGYPFDGKDTSNNANGYYGVWICDANGNMAEADAFYKARCNAYLQSYIEFYTNEYGNTVTRTIANSISQLDGALNEYFVKLVNDSSDHIYAGNVDGFTVENGIMTPVSDSSTAGENASWLYIDPSIGNDTNTDEISTSTGGWWYLVESDYSTGTAEEGKLTIKTVTDSILDPEAGGTNSSVDGTGFVRNTTTKTDTTRLTAKLFEIVPEIDTTEVVGKNGTNDVTKVVSVSFPFVNGTFALPGDALTNVFANAKISFQISFQALQAFFPYTTAIDGVDYTNTLLGTAKALNIQNAIPIFNEAFDYNEVSSNESYEGLL